MLMLNAADVRRLLPMNTCIEVIGEAMRAASSGAVTTPERIITPLADGDSYFFVMPGVLTESTVYGAKVVGLHPGNAALGRPAIQGFVALFDGGTGCPLALVDGAEITRIRTAAASALATRLLARPDASTHGILGAGVQAEAHLEAVACVRGIERVLVWARNSDKARQFASAHSRETGLNVAAVENAADAAACDVVSVVTHSPDPVLRGAWLRPGGHLNLVGAHEPHHREADTEAVTRARVYVDSRRGALSEAGDLLMPIAEGRFAAGDIVGEIGAVLAGAAPGRANGEQITLYKSLGIVAQDLYAGVYVLRQAQLTGVGIPVEFP
jgi:ornithine cyclodeaminase